MIINGIKISKKYVMFIILAVVNYAQYTLGLELPNDLVVGLNSYGLPYIVGQGIYDKLKQLIGYGLIDVIKKMLGK